LARTDVAPRFWQTLAGDRIELDAWIRPHKIFIEIFVGTWCYKFAMSDSSEGQEGIHHERQRNILTQPIDFLDPEECGDNEFDLNKEKDHSSGENIVTKSSGEQDDEEVGDELAAPTSDDDDSQAGQGLIEHHKKKKKKKKVCVWLFSEWNF